MEQKNYLEITYTLVWNESSSYTWQNLVATMTHILIKNI